MTKTLSRAELYELVWTRPRTALSKELGVSDVAIGKQCTKANVPAPPAGYWARLNAGGLARRTPLPVRLPGQADLVEVGQGTGRYWPVEENLDEPLQAPVFLEVLDEQVGYAVKRIGRVVATRDLQTPDPSLSRVLAAEAKRQVKYRDERWGQFYKPYFDEPVYQRQMRIFNSLARALLPLYGRQEVRCEDEWIQGVGTLHHLVLILSFGGARIDLRFSEPSQARTAKRAKAVQVTTLRVDGDRSDQGVDEWSDLPRRKLEDQLTDIIRALLNRAELSLRAHAQWVFEQRTERRREQLAAIEARKREEEKQRLAAIATRKAKIRDEIIEIARRRRVAEDIRTTVDVLRAHPEVQSEHAATFEAWTTRALQVANEMDPLLGPLNVVLGTFATDD